MCRASRRTFVELKLENIFVQSENNGEHEFNEQLCYVIILSCCTTAG